MAEIIKKESWWNIKLHSVACVCVCMYTTEEARTSADVTMG